MAWAQCDEVIDVDDVRVMNDEVVEELVDVDMLDWEEDKEVDELSLALLE